MNVAGNHGGNDPGESESTLLFASPKFRKAPLKKEYECPIAPEKGAEFLYYNTVEQQDLVPTLCGLMGLPIPHNNIGKVLGELRQIWSDDESYVRVLEQNAHQIWSVVETVFNHAMQLPAGSTEDSMPESHHEPVRTCMNTTNTVDDLGCLLSVAKQHIQDSTRTQQWAEAADALETFLAHAQKALINEYRPFNVTRMAAGVVLCTLALISCLYSINALSSSSTTGIFSASIALLYGATLLGSASERGEQMYWFCFLPAWTIFLAAKAMARANDESTKNGILRATFGILMLHCIATTWRLFTPFVERDLFVQHAILMWFTMLIAFSWNWSNICRYTFRGVMNRSIAGSLTLPLMAAAFLFKISSEHGESYQMPWLLLPDRIILFRTILALIALVTAITCVLVARNHSRGDGYMRNKDALLSERLHHVLTLFLMVQSRPANIPLFMCLEYQQLALKTLLELKRPISQSHMPMDGKRDSQALVLSTAVSIFAFSHTYFFCFGGSNSISSVDLSNAYNGISNYNIVKVAILLFSANWTGPIWWCSAACSLVPRRMPGPEQGTTSSNGTPSSEGWKSSDVVLDCDGGSTSNGHQPAWLTYLSTMTTLMTARVLIVMVLCITQRGGPMVWRVWGPKHLYDMFWVLEWHIAVLFGLSSILRGIGKLG